MHLSSVLPLMWKILSSLNDEDTREMKGSIKQTFRQCYDDEELKLLLNTATYLDPRFKDSLVTLEAEVKKGFWIK